MNSTSVGAPVHFILPVSTGSTVGPLPLAFGLHLMAGVKASGKTVTSLAIALLAHKSEVPSHYEYVMEPRADSVVELLKTGEWEKHLRSICKRYQHGVVVVDSLTYLVSKLDESVKLDESLSRVTYAGGLSPRDIMGILLHDQLARESQVALIGTLNAELFPVIEKLGGACEGEFLISGTGVIQHRDRTTRTYAPFTIPDDCVNGAFDALGYPRSAVSRIDRY